MALDIKHPDADRLARELAVRTGESLTDAVLNAIRERLRREETRRKAPSLRRELEKIRKRCSALPVRDGAARRKSSGTTNTESVVGGPGGILCRPFCQENHFTLLAQRLCYNKNDF
jgi:antitoxin VapB